MEPPKIIWYFFRQTQPTNKLEAKGSVHPPDFQVIGSEENKKSTISKNNLQTFVQSNLDEKWLNKTIPSDAHFFTDFQIVFL